MIREERIGRAQLLLGDCREVLPTLPRVDAVVTSPPYNLGNPTKGSFYQGQSKGKTISYLSHGDDMPESEYIDWQHELFGMWFDLLNNGGCIAYNHKPRVVDGVYDDRRNLIPLPIRQEIVWDRCCMVNFSGSFFAPQSETVFIVAKEGWRPQRDCVGWGNIWRVPPETSTPHPAPMPLALARKIVAGCSSPEATILDPFMGSGTTGVAAVQMGRDFIGVEREPDYFDIACRRIEDAQKQGDLFIEGAAA